MLQLKRLPRLGWNMCQTRIPKNILHSFDKHCTGYSGAGAVRRPKSEGNRSLFFKKLWKTRHVLFKASFLPLFRALYIFCLYPDNRKWGRSSRVTCRGAIIDRFQRRLNFQRLACQNSLLDGETGTGRDTGGGALHLLSQFSTIFPRASPPEIRAQR